MTPLVERMKYSTSKIYFHIYTLKTSVQCSPNLNANQTWNEATCIDTSCFWLVIRIHVVRLPIGFLPHLFSSHR